MAVRTKKKTSTATYSPGALMTREVFEKALDRDFGGVNQDPLVEALISEWGYDFETLRPGQAYLYDGAMSPADLDLASLMTSLAKRKAVIILPDYIAGSGSARQTRGQKLLSHQNRHGQLLGLVSNKEFFSMSAKVNDMNVLNVQDGGSLGAPRNFYLLGKDGRWHPGWSSIQFVPDVTENSFLKTFDFAKRGKVAFENFVHPNRWVSFYGAHYLLTKIFIQKLMEESKELRDYIKTLPKEPSPPYGGPKGGTGGKPFSTKKERVPVFTAEIDAPLQGEFNDADSWGPQGAKERLKTVNSQLAQLRFIERSTELAFYKARGEKAGYPRWIRSMSWLDEKRGRTKWRALDVTSLIPGAPGKMTLRYRIRAKTIDVDR